MRAIYCIFYIRKLLGDVSLRSRCPPPRCLGYPLSGSTLRSCTLVWLAQSSKSLIRNDSDSQKLMLILCFVANDYAFLIRKDSGSQKLMLIACFDTKGFRFSETSDYTLSKHGMKHIQLL
jgi:hypothetical protein